ncbi:hypothetical protein BDF14DRAFT_1883641 [Spinellus fusiger]|nr:hypothetical protein BDF14DRAFT_1883641 [Spinellus fusiger]
MEDQDSLSWIKWFCSEAAHQYYINVPESFIADSFNLTGLLDMIPFYKDALEMVLDLDPDDETFSRIPDFSLLIPHAQMLYGMVHQRYITTDAGLRQMLLKYNAGHFGYCPRVHCERFKVLPCGQHDMPKQSSVCVYCPNCKDIYKPASSRFSSVDGAHFGTSFPHLFIQAFPRVIPQQTTSTYVAKLFGFRIHAFSPGGSRMQWLRLAPGNDPSL